MDKNGSNSFCGAIWDTVKAHEETERAQSQKLDSLE
jgi:hypothetical protein